MLWELIDSMVKRRRVDEQLEQAYHTNGQLQQRLQGAEAVIHHLENQLIGCIDWHRLKLDEVRDAWGRERFEAETVRQELERKIDALEKQLSEESFGGSYSDSSATPTMFEAALAQANEAIHNLATSIDPRKVAASGGDVVFARRIHRRFAVRAALCDVFFAGFESESFGCGDDAELLLDHEEQRRRLFAEYRRMESDIRNYCSDEFDRWKREKMEALYRRVDGFHEDEQRFDKAAAAVWKLHLLGLSFYPAARIFRVVSGRKVEAAFMESVMTDEDLEEDEDVAEAMRIGERVAFAVSPGFSIRKTVFKSLVYPVLEKAIEAAAEEKDRQGRGGGKEEVEDARAGEVPVLEKTITVAEEKGGKEEVGLARARYDPVRGESSNQVLPGKARTYATVWGKDVSCGINQTEETVTGDLSPGRHGAAVGKKVAKEIGGEGNAESYDSESDEKIVYIRSGK